MAVPTNICICFQRLLTCARSYAYLGSEKSRYESSVFYPCGVDFVDFVDFVICVVCFNFYLFSILRWEFY